MNYKEHSGLKKKSFELNYNGGTIWCEHLDALGNLEQEVIDKFSSDITLFSRPSVSSYMIINLDETVITERIVNHIIDEIENCPKKCRKIAFVGVKRIWKKDLKCIQTNTGAIVSFIDDYEKAKEWILFE